MKIKLYVDWQEEKILKEEEYEKEMVECAKDIEDDDYEFGAFLNSYFDQNLYLNVKLAYLFNLSKEEREEILEQWKKDCLNTAKNNSCDDYKEIEIEI